MYKKGCAALRLHSPLFLSYVSVFNVKYVSTAAVDKLHIVRNDKHGNIIFKGAEKLRSTFHAPEIKTAGRFIEYEKLLSCK